MGFLSHFLHLFVSLLFLYPRFFLFLASLQLVNFPSLLFSLKLVGTQDKFFEGLSFFTPQFPSGRAFTRLFFVSPPRMKRPVLLLPPLLPVSARESPFFHFLYRTLPAFIYFSPYLATSFSMRSPFTPELLFPPPSIVCFSQLFFFSSSFNFCGPMDFLVSFFPFHLLAYRCWFPFFPPHLLFFSLSRLPSVNLRPLFYTSTPY